jgi:hypothetical protein
MAGDERSLLSRVLDDPRAVQNEMGANRGSRRASAMYGGGSKPSAQSNWPSQVGARGNLYNHAWGIKAAQNYHNRKH